MTPIVSAKNMLIVPNKYKNALCVKGILPVDSKLGFFIASYKIPT
jgi:hypothetical protein